MPFDKGMTDTDELSTRELLLAMRRETEAAITAALEKFEAETGLRVKTIQVDRHEFYISDDVRSYAMSKVGPHVHLGVEL